MKSVTLAELSNGLDLLLNEILKTGIPLEVDYQGKRLRITPVETVDKLQKLVYRPDDLVHITWEQEINIA